MLKFGTCRFESECDDFLIRIVDLPNESHRYLYFDETIQGVLDLGKPERPVLEYVGLIASLAEAAGPYGGDVVVAGLGACTSYHALCPVVGETRIHVVEVEGKLVDLGRRFFQLPEKSWVSIADLGDWVFQEPGYYELVVMDCYGASEMPPHLMTREFMQALKSRLTPGGSVIFNIWDPGCNVLCGHQVRTILDVFGQIGLITCREDDNLVVFTGRVAEMDLKRLRFRQSNYQIRTVSLSAPPYRPGWLEAGEVIEEARLYRFLGRLL